MLPWSFISIDMATNKTTRERVGDRVGISNKFCYSDSLGIEKGKPNNDSMIYPSSKTCLF